MIAERTETKPPPPAPPAPRVLRAREGRVLGGVCAGLPPVRGMGTNALRTVFVLAALCGGVGLVVYLACWLVFPEAGEDPDAADTGTRSIVLLAWGTGGLMLLAAAATVSVIAAVFGFGWVVVAAAAVVLILVLGPLSPRVPSGVGLLAVAALIIPALAVALSPLRLTFQTGAATSRPATAAAIEHTVFRSGFGTRLIDLRHTTLPASGTVTMHVDAGLRRTIVALPADRCVYVHVHYLVHPFASQLATLLSGHEQTPFHGIVMFGTLYGLGSDHHGTIASAGVKTGPVLNIDFSSQGGSLYVRDYPSGIGPVLDPDWPGYTAAPEPRPYLGDEPHRLWKSLIAAWKTRLAVDGANQRLVNQRMPGPCAS